MLIIFIFVDNNKKMYQDISLGFELETQLLCLVLCKGKRLSLPTDYTKHAYFQHSVEVYNDTLTPGTVFATREAAPFLETLGAMPTDAPLVLNSDGYVLERPVKFNNGEFVVTLARKQSMARDQFFVNILRQFLGALERVRTILQEEYRVLPISDQGFPYRSLVVSRTRDPRYAKVGFFAQKAPDSFSVDDLVFYYQCTVGFRMEDAISILYDLAQRFHDTPNVMEPWVHMAQTLGGGASPLLVNYLFLFLYSASTRHSRKVGTLFILRHAFQDLRVVLTEEDLTRLDAWMRTNRPADEHAYFRSLHFEEVSQKQQQKFQKQALWDVGRLPFRKSEGRVFVEFRGFQSVLNAMVGKGTPRTVTRVKAALESFL